MSTACTGLWPFSEINIFFFYDAVDTGCIPSLRIIMSTTHPGNRWLSLPLNISVHTCLILPIAGIMHKANSYSNS